MSDGFKSNKFYQLQLALALSSICILETAKGSPAGISSKARDFLAVKI